MPWVLCVVALVALLVAMVFPFRASFRTDADSSYFIAIARVFSESAHVELASAHAHAGSVDRGYGLNSYLLAVGLLSRALGQDVLRVWGTLSICGLVFFICAVYLITCRLFASPRIALAVTAFAILHRFSGYFVFPPSAYANPSMHTRPLALVLLWVFTELHRNPTRRNVACFGLLGAAILSVHPYGLLFALLCLLGAVAVCAATERGGERRRVLARSFAAFGVLTVLAAPYLLLKWRHYFSSDCPLYSTDWNSLFPIVQNRLTQVRMPWDAAGEAATGLMARPSQLLYGHPWLGWLGLPLVASLLWKRSGVSRLHAGLLVGGVFFAVAVACNPLLFPPLSRIFTPHVLARLSHKNPMMAIAVLGAMALWVKMAYSVVKWRWLRYSVIGFLSLAALAYACVTANTRWGEYKTACARREQVKGWFKQVDAGNLDDEPFLSVARENLKPGETVLNTPDKTVERALCPLLNMRVYHLKDNWASMNLPWTEHLARKETVGRFRDEGDAERWAIARDAGVRHVITDAKLRLGRPFFRRLATSRWRPRLCLYRVATPKEAGRAGRDPADGSRQ